MNYEVKQSWKVIIPIDAEKTNYLSSNKLFNCLTGNNFIKGIGGIEKLGLQPIVLQPTIAFHNALSKHREQLGFFGKKFPYSFSKNEVNINIHYYLEQYVILTVSVKRPIFCEYVEIATAQDLSKQEQLNKLVLVIAGLIKSGKTKGFKPLSSIKFYPCTIIYENAVENILSERQSVEILTRHPGVIDNIVNKVISKNSEHQINASRVLADKQGVLHIIPFTLASDTETTKKFKSVASLLELSIILSRSLNDNILNHHVSYNREIRKLIETPELVIQHSVTAKNTFDLFIKEFKLKSLLATKNEINENQPIETKNSLQDKWKNFIGSKEFFATLLAAALTALIALLMFIIEPND
jgi:hypothetical protein